jgi:hypothetical protein
VLNVDLPPGRLAVPDDAGPGTRPAYWLGDAPAGPELWVQLRRAHARSGLWPVIASALQSDPDQPWAAGNVRPQPAADIDGLDANSAMAGLWRE